MKWLLPAILVLAFFGALWPTLAGAQEPTARVLNTGPFPLIIDGESVFTFPFQAPLGSQACIVTEVRYSSDVERLQFQGWLHGSSQPDSSDCITLDGLGEYTASYRNEVLLTVNSQVRVFRQSVWVPRGEPVDLPKVPELVEVGTGQRFLFEQWTAGENRFSPENTIVPSRPLTIEVLWTKEFFLDLQGPPGVELTGVGWHKEGASVVLKAQSRFESEEEGVQRQFRDWESISNPAVIIPNRQQPQTTIRMDNSHTIRANFELAFLVVISDPLRENSREFVRENREIIIETEPTIVIIEGEERLVFKEWEGIDLDKVKGAVKVDGPKDIVAIYDREYNITVEAPYGDSGSGWHKAGSTAIITVPEKPSAIFFLNRSFNGFDGFATNGALLELPVTGPRTVTASYSTKVDVKFIFIIIAIAAVAVPVYFLSQREYNRRRHRGRW